MEDTDRYDIYNIIGKNIKKYRCEKGYTQRSLADALLLSENFIAKLESSTYQTISIDTLKTIADFLHVDIKNFFDNTVMNQKTNQN